MAEVLTDYPRDYDAYMTFAEPLQDPAEARVVRAHLRTLGATNISFDDADAAALKKCYDDPLNRRYFHDGDHRDHVGQPDVPPALAARLQHITPEEAKALLALSGLWHDSAYKQFDIQPDGSNIWPEFVQRHIADQAEATLTYQPDSTATYWTELTDTGRGNPITQMTAHLFDMPQGSITNERGGNEFDSALGFAHFLHQQGVPDRHIIAGVAIIAATFPFQRTITRNTEGTIVDDGDKGQLAHRIHSSRHLDFQADWGYINDIMVLSTHLANRDISSFAMPDNFPLLLMSGQRVRVEERPELDPTKPTNARALGIAAALDRSAGFLYRSIATGGHVPAANVSSIYIPRNDDGSLKGLEHAYPPVPVYEEACAHIEHNSGLTTKLLEAHHAGTLVVAALGRLIGEPTAPVPGIVDAHLWQGDALPHKTYNTPFTDDEKKIFLELMHGPNQHDIGKTVTARSPLGGMIFGALGIEGLRALTETIDAMQAKLIPPNRDVFVQEDEARNYLRTVSRMIGAENYRVIGQQLMRVAEHYSNTNKGSLQRMARISQVFRQTRPDSTTDS